jgi:ATP-dependent RNA helicase RhlE
LQKLKNINLKFSEYPITPELKKNIEKLGYKKPTDIQYKTMTPILKGEDVLAIPQTGTGKTGAFAIPVISKLHDKKKNARQRGFNCIIMEPTRELALQVSEVIQELSKFTHVKVTSLFGGVEQDAQIKKLVDGVDIVVSTPGRLFDLSSQGYLDLTHVEILILDEADHMLDLGFIDDIRDLIKRLPKQRQTLFFSATIDKKIKKLAYSIVNKPFKIEISPKDPVNKNINHAYLNINQDNKRFLLERIVNENPDFKILVFVRTKVRAERVVKQMERVGVSAEAIHGDRYHKGRFEVMRRFKDDSFRLLIATDVSARGIDIPNVDLVVNYDLPEKEENYVHRVGRTGRANKKGQAISFCSDDETDLLNCIQDFLGKDIEKVDIKEHEVNEAIELSGAGENNWKALIEMEAKKNSIKQRKKRI